MSDKKIVLQEIKEKYGEDVPLKVKRSDGVNCYEFVFSRSLSHPLSFYADGEPMYLLCAKQEGRMVTMEPSGAAVFRSKENKTKKEGGNNGI